MLQLFELTNDGIYNSQVMLTEQFVASIGVPAKASGTHVTKDAGIFVCDIQPLVAQRALFKKSATPRNGLVTNDNHIFAAQAEKGVVHVYNREKGNQEATVPFTERITCLAFACENTVLVLGTQEGRIFLWEICTGRLVATAQSHLQAVTAVAIDQTSSFLLSASADSTVHTWSLLSLLSFSNAGSQQATPVRTFTNHRAEITDLAIGHSSSLCNFAVSTSKDRTCLIWDYHTNGLLRTYLLPASPVCLTLDAADRAVYLGHDDGSIQQIDLYQPSHEEGKLEAIQDKKNATVPRQPSTSSLWKASGDVNGSVLSISLSFDGCTLLSGYESGAVISWDVASGRPNTNLLQNPLPGPITTLSFLEPLDPRLPIATRFKIPAVVKPKVGAFDTSDGFVPGNYTMHVEMTAASKALGRRSAFRGALTAPSFSLEYLESGLNELATWHSKPPNHGQSVAPENSDDFMAFTNDSNAPTKPTLEERNADLEAQLDALRRVQKVSFDKIDKLSAERKALLQREQQRLLKHGAAGLMPKINGTGRGRVEVDVDMSDVTDDSEE